MSMTPRVAICVLLGGAAIGVSAGCKTTLPLGEVRTSVCDLDRHGRDMAGRHVRVSALFATDHHHFAVLYGRDCPRTALTLSLSESKSRDKSVDDLKKAIYAFPEDYATNPGRWSAVTTLSLDVSGEFTWSSAAGGAGQLIVEKVWSYKRLPLQTTREAR